MTDALTFLQSVGGYVAATESNGSADRPIKLAVIDPAYVASSFPGTLPKVTFEGESTLSGKLYPVAAPYWPHPSDKVWMVPIGSTYLIVGSRIAGSGAVYMTGQTPITSQDLTDQAFDGTSFAAGSPVVGHSFTAPANGIIRVDLYAGLRLELSESGTRTLSLSYEIRAGSTVGSGTVQSGASADEDRSVMTGIGATSGMVALQFAGATFYHTLTGGASYNIRTMHRENGTAISVCQTRRVTTSSR